MLHDLNGTHATSNWLNFNKFGLKCQQWQLLYKYNCWFQSYDNTLAFLMYSLSHCVDSEKFSVRNRGVGCPLAWVTIARDPESDCPFYFVVQFRRIRAGHLWCQISSGSTKLRLSVSSGSYCTSIIVGSRVMVTHLLPYTLTIALCGQ